MRPIRTAGAALAVVVIALVAIATASWWSVERRFDEFVRKTSSIEKGMTQEQVIQLLGRPTRVETRPDSKSQCREHGASREVTFLFANEALFYRIVRVVPPRYEYVACLDNDGRVAWTFTAITTY